MDESDAGISSYTPLNFEAGEESAEVDQLRADWGFEGWNRPKLIRMHNRVSEKGIDQIISEFDSTQNYDDEFINISPKQMPTKFPSDLT